MEDLQAALQSILSDPRQMEQVMAMAGALGLQPPEGLRPDPAPSEEASAPGPEPDPAAQPAIPGVRADTGLLRLSGGMPGIQGPEDQVFSALRTVISDPAKIQRAIRAAKLSRLARQLLRGDQHHV